MHWTPEKEVLPGSHSGILSGDGSPHVHVDSNQEASPKPLGLPDLGYPASELKKFHFFAKSAGFRSSDIEKYIYSSIAS